MYEYPPAVETKHQYNCGAQKSISTNLIKVIFLSTYISKRMFVRGNRVNVETRGATLLMNLPVSIITSGENTTPGFAEYKPSLKISAGPGRSRRETIRTYEYF